MWGSFYSQLTVLSALYLYPLLCHLSVVAKYLQFQSGHSGARHTTLLHHPAQPHLSVDISRDFVDVATTVYCLCPKWSLWVTSHDTFASSSTATPQCGYIT